MEMNAFRNKQIPKEVAFCGILLIGAILMSIMPMFVSKSVTDAQFFQIFCILFFSCLLVPVTLAQGDSLGSYLYHFCEGVNNLTSRSDFQYRVNINLLLFKRFTDSEVNSLFYNTTHGMYPEVYGLYSCRGDLSVADCKSCIYQAGQEIFLERCAYGRNAMIWYEGCFIRYANTSFFSTMVRKPELYIWGQRNISMTGDFDLTVANMFRNLSEMASSDPSTLNYATAVVPFSESLRLYGLVQCIRDMSRSDCKSCLDKAIESMFGSKHAKENGRYLCPSCVMRYDIYSFTRRPMSPLDDSSGSNKGKIYVESMRVTPSVGTKGGKKLQIAIGVSLSVALLLVLSALYLVHFRRRKRIKGENIITSNKTKTMRRRSVDDENFSSASQQKSLELPLVSFNVISVATKQFSAENKLGEGGFGPVYKGTLPNGEEIAVKRHVRTSLQGLQEYENEVSLIANLQHRNLVKLLGCCLEGNELLLIYEYMPNKSLDIALSDPVGNMKLDWTTRFSIINGIAKGVLYLHEDSRLRIIHRDLKASNVLLDHEMNPKISDFGLARIFFSNQNMANTERVVGTYGYMAPEYAMEGLFSAKSDVYSFGILLLEIITGKKNSSFNLSSEGLSLISYAWTLWSESETQGMDLLDPSLKNSYTPSEVLKCIHIALLCVQDNPADRPTMSSVVLMLGNESETTITLQKPSQPTFTVHRFNRKRAESTPEDLSTSVNDVTMSCLSPR